VPRTPSAGRSLLVVAALLLFGYYAWTASSAGNPLNKVNPYQFKYGDSDYYNLQADAFLHGHIALDVPVAPELKAAKNPYDPAVPGARLPDASLYNDHYYLSWGPAPAITTFLPFRLVGVQLRENLAIVIYGFLGVLAACASLALLVRRLVPGTSRAVIWSGWLTLALAGALPFILRRPTVYEVALTGAFCFGMVGFYLLLRETVRPLAPRTSRLAIVGVLFGLAVLTRPTFGPVAVAMAGLAYLLRHDGRLPRGLTPMRKRAIALAIGIPVLAGVLFMVYNVVRFSGPLDFGSKYQMAGRDVRFIPYNSFGNLVPALFGYVVAPLRIGLEFPYVHLPPPPAAPLTLPAGFGPEATGSIFWSVPLLLLAIVAAGRAAVGRIRGRRVLSPLVGRVVLVLVAIGAIPFVLGIYSIPGYTERYELDFLPCMMIAAVLAWAELTRVAATPRRAALWRRGGVLLAVYGVIIGVAIGFTGYYDGLKANNPKVFDRLQRVFSPLPTAVTVLAGHPIIAGASAPGGIMQDHVGYATLGPGNSTITVRPDAPARLTVVSPGKRMAQVRFTAKTDVPGRFVVTVAAHGHPTATTVRNGTLAGVPVQLHRGINDVDLTIAPVVPIAPGAAQPAVALQATRVQ
jgi:hypothetical protein